MTDAPEEDNVVPLNCISKLPIPPDRVLKAAIGELETVILIGRDKNGEEYFAASDPDGGEVLWLVERFKLLLVRGDFGPSWYGE